MLEVVIGGGLVAGVLGAYLVWLRRANPGTRWLPWRGIGHRQADTRSADFQVNDPLLFELLAEGLKAVFWLASPDLSRVYYVSPYYEAVTGHSTVDLYADASSWRSVLHPAAAAPPPGMAYPSAADSVFEREAPFMRADGTSGWSRVRIQPVHDAQGTLIARLGMVTDITPYKQLEEALQASEANYRNVAEHASDGIVIIQDRVVCYGNPRMAHMLGCTVDQLMGRPFEHFVAPEHRLRLLALNARGTQEQPETAPYEILLSHTDGRGVEAEISVRQTDYDGQPALLVFVHDMTERNQVEVALLRSEERYRSLFEESPVGLWEEDFSMIKAQVDDLRAQGVDDFRAYFEAHPDEMGRIMSLVRILDVNRTTLKMTRAIDKEEAVRAFKQGQPPEAIALMREQLTAIAEGKLSFSGEGIGLTVGRDRYDMLLSWSVMSGYEDTLSKVIVSMQDITRQKAAEKALRQSEARSEAILSAIPDLMYRADRDGVYLDLRGVDTMPLPVTAVPHAGQYVGKSLHEVLPKPQADHILEHVRRALDTGEMQFVEYRLPTTDGERDYEARIVASEPDEVVTIVRDITERKRAEVERERLIVEVNAFGRTVAHDLKTPLTAIMGYTEMLTDEFHALSENDIREFLWIIAHDSQKMSRIIDELMLLASVRELDEVHMRPLDMNLIVTSALGRMGYMIRERDARIALPLGGWPMARGYAPWVEEIWANYLSNAIKYGGDPLVIELGADPPKDGRVRFWIHDNGPGIAPEDQKRLFTQFTRLDDLRAQGHGLGLSIVLRIVEKLGGTVGVESTPGVGSTFDFTLPAAGGT